MRQLFPRNNFVPARILASSTRLAIGEAPGETEAAIGEPFVGSAGSWLRGRINEKGQRVGGLYYKAGVRDEEMAYANVISCRPPDNVFPTDAEARSYISAEDAEAAVSHCVRAHLRPVIEGRPWKRLDLLGAKALSRVAGPQYEGINRWRGSPLPVEGLNDGKPIAIATLHPANIARNQTMIPAVLTDLKKSLTLPPETYNTHPSLEDVKNFAAPIFAFDIETNPETDEILCVGLSARPYHAIIVPFQGAYLSELKRIFWDAQEVIGQNIIQFDLPHLEWAGVVVADGCKLWDIMLMHHLIAPHFSGEHSGGDEDVTKKTGGGGHSLAFIGSLFTNKPAWKPPKGVVKRPEDFDLETYCCRDVDVTLQAWTQIKPLLKQHRLVDLYFDVQVPLAKICHLMHVTGVKVNPNKIREVRERLLAESQKFEQALPEHLRTFQQPRMKRVPAPEGYRSPKTNRPLKFMMVESSEEIVPWRTDALRKFLYEELALPQQLHVKTHQVTTDKIALEKLARMVRRGQARRTDTGEVVDPTAARQLEAVQRLRKLNGMLTQSIQEGLLDVERQHTSFNVHGTASGRLSSSGPNLQNVTEAARVIYVPDAPDWELLEVDYSQIENRLTAWFAHDTERLARYLRNPDFSEHKYAASIFFHIPYEDVEKDNDKDAPYGKAKRIVHGVNYGMGAMKIARMYDMNLNEVKELIARWKAEIAPTSRWQETCAALAKSQGYLTTPFGRKRWFYTQSYYTEALSFLPQSTAADIIYRAMLGLMSERIGWSSSSTQKVVSVAKPLPEPAKLLLQVHDSLLFAYPRPMRDEVVDTVKTVMEQPWPELGGFSIPIGIAAGPSWGELEKVKL